ncbi:hypothetical protein HanRHA438_Chr03g0105181 [Helianthus annuus]|nr:hypothetical protein HanRHA438_Chr03g0105181 [Helianthus annuus]
MFNPIITTCSPLTTHLQPTNPLDNSIPHTLQINSASSTLCFHTLNSSNKLSICKLSKMNLMLKRWEKIFKFLLQIIMEVH